MTRCSVPRARSTISEAIRARQKSAGIVSPYVFPMPSDLSRPYSNLDRHWHTVRTAAEMPTLRLHDLRHDVASDYGMRYPAAVVKSMAGHATLASTSKYIHAKDDPMTRAADTVTTDRAKRLANAKAAKPVTPLHSSGAHDAEHTEQPEHAERTLSA